MALRPAARTVVCLSKAIVGEATNVNAQSPTYSFYFSGWLSPTDGFTMLNQFATIWFFFFNMVVIFQTQMFLTFCHIWVHWQAWKRWKRHAVLSHLRAVKFSSQSRSQSRVHRQEGDYSTADPQERYHLHVIIQLSANTVTGDTLP